MTEKLCDAVNKTGMDLEPRVNRRRPFDLHWRKTPTTWPDNVAMTHRGSYRQRPTSDEFCCVQCGSRPCPFDHSDQGRAMSQDVTFVGKLVAERNSLRDQLNEVIMIARCYTLMTATVFVAAA